MSMKTVFIIVFFWLLISLSGYSSAHIVSKVSLKVALLAIMALAAHSIWKKMTKKTD